MTVGGQDVALSNGRLRLLSLCQSIDYGAIESFEIRDGEPILTGPIRIVRNIRFDKRDGPNKHREQCDVALKDAHRKLFALFDLGKSFKIARLEVRDGLPCGATIEQVQSEETLKGVVAPTLRALP